MSAQAKPKSKGARAPANANNDADSIMPLLLATLGNPTISFKKMAAMDELSRTESSLEHTFRKWRQKGREIAAQNPAHAGTLGTSDAAAGITKKPRASAKEGANGRGKDPIAKASVKGEDDEEGKAKEMVFFGGTNSTEKRAASFQVTADIPTKKAKVAKKGTAKVVKKPKAQVDPSSEEEDTESGEEGKVSAKPNGKGKEDKADGTIEMQFDLDA